jgi:hypothetical protein
MDDFDSRTYVVACWHQIFEVFDWVTRRTVRAATPHIHLDHVVVRKKDSRLVVIITPSIIVANDFD